ncbi:PREDICTED: uncharacterized protein LOC103596888, partial [Galeopterus variegatus]|uniref:Uncharacterized protein LOC103596888 n=1 Tax=Galeopterus variegatus TaxID=482537 RepID=A0ABM0RE32_GALVR
MAMGLLPYLVVSSNKGTLYLVVSWTKSPSTLAWRGSSQTRPSRSTPLGSLIANLPLLSLQGDIKPKQLLFYCNQVWPRYKLDNGSQWPENAIWKERGFMTTQGGPIKNGHLIRTLLEAAQLPKEVRVIHCRGRQASSSPIAQGNKQADLTAKQAAQSSDPHTSFTQVLLMTPMPSPQYTPQEARFTSFIQDLIRDGSQPASFDVDNILEWVTELAWQGVLCDYTPYNHMQAFANQKVNELFMEHKYQPLPLEDLTLRQDDGSFAGMIDLGRGRRHLGHSRITDVIMDVTGAILDATDVIMDMTGAIL